MRITVKDRLLYHGDQIVGLPLADTIAQANGYPWVERMVKEHDGQELVLHPTSYVIQEVHAAKQ